MHKPRPGERLTLDLSLTLRAAIRMRRDTEGQVSEAATIRTILIQSLKEELRAVVRFARAEEAVRGKDPS